MDMAAFQASKDRVRERFNRFTRKAFEMLPKMDRPFILDVGCGSGVPTMELAEISNGQIIALDINHELINRLAVKIEKAGLSDRVKVIEYRRSCAGDPQAVAALDKEQQEIDVFEKDPARCRSVFFIMSRR